MKNIINKAKKGMAYLTLERVISEVIHFGGSIPLARILLPADFGINGLAQFFTGFAMRFGNFGFNQALIQKKEITPDHFSTILIINIVINTTSFITLILLSKFIGEYFNTPLLGSVIAVISIDFIIQALAGVPLTILQRNMQFGKIAMIRFISETTNIFVSITMALSNYGVWSLVFGKLAADTVRMIMLYILSKYIPSFRYKHKALKDLFSFGVWVFWRNQFKYLSNNIDYFIIGKTLGPSALGFYERAFNLMSKPVGKITMEVDGVLFSTFSRMQEKKERIKSAYKKGILSVSLFACPFFGGLFIIAPSFIPIIYGKKWIPTIIPLRILCLVGLIRSINILSRSIITAKGYVKEEVFRQAIFFIALVIGCIIGSRWGINGVAAMVVFANILLVTMMINLLSRINDITLKDFCVPQLPAILYTSIMIFGIIIFQKLSKKIFQFNTIQGLIIIVLIGMALYSVSALVFKTKLTKPLLVEIKENLKKILLSLQLGFRFKIKEKIM